MERYCSICGTQLIDGICPECVQQNNDSQQRINDRFTKFFMLPNEKLVVTLGDSYLQKFLRDGSIKKGFAVVSDKRVYFRGKSYDITNGRDGQKSLIRNQKAKTVDLKDVTGTSIERYTDIKWLIFLVIYFLIIIGVVVKWYMEV